MNRTLEDIVPVYPISHSHVRRIQTIATNPEAPLGKEPIDFYPP